MQSETYAISAEGVFGRHGKLDPWNWAWQATPTPTTAEPATAERALAAIAASGEMRRIPVGVIGPREATAEQLAAAEAVGAALGALGLTMLCGGKSGVMAAASKGCRQAGGLSVGLLPDHDWRAANGDVVLPIATGLSEARNMIIAKASAVLVAVGGSYGTLSEIAYGLHFGRPVIGLAGAPAIDGMELVERPEEAVARLAEHLLAMATAVTST